MTCPVCGQRVEIQTGDEGTSSYVPTVERELQRLRTALDLIRTIPPKKPAKIAVDIAEKSLGEGP